MVRFVMGDLDLDKDWDSYLNELEKLQYKQLVEMDQAAFDRSFGK
jgi:putative aldouronate transport system substrate-binding protein